jgi:hypothetical protein
MGRFHPHRFGWLLALTFGLSALATQAAVAARPQEFRYRYVALDKAALPTGFSSFFPAAIQDSGRVYGTACDDACSDPRIVFFKDGAVTVLAASGNATSVNARGTVGGFVLADPVNFVFQAALFRGDKVERIPPQPDEISSMVVALNDRDVAIVQSDDALGQVHYLRYSHGQATPLDFGPSVTNPALSLGGGLRSINNEGAIAGTAGERFVSDRAFRFAPRTGEATILSPLPTEPLAWGLGINNRGDVLGYSFIFGGLERIGVWDRQGVFQTYVVEGTPETPTISNRLLFNDKNMIVITLANTRGSSRKTSYLVPRPGVRLDLADLVESLPAGQDLRLITDMNNRGDMIGTSSSGANFLLERVDASDS